MRNVTRGAGLVLAALLLSVGACSGDDDGPAGADGGVSMTTVVDEEAPSIGDDPLVAGLSGDQMLVVTSPASGGGDRPLLSWSAVDGAVLYSVVVYDIDGAPYWGWETENIEVRVGLSDRPDDAPGPRVADGMTWAVVAYGAEGIPIAASAVQPIAP